MVAEALLLQPIRAGVGPSGIRALTELARGQPDLVGAFRRYLIPGMAIFPPTAHAVLELFNGLDGDNPALDRRPPRFQAGLPRRATGWTKIAAGAEMHRPRAFPWQHALPGASSLTVRWCPHRPIILERRRQ